MRSKSDFIPKSIPSDFGKKLERIPISCSAEFKEIFKIFVQLNHANSDSELGFRYLVEGMQHDLGTHFMNNLEILYFLQQDLLE